MVLFKILVVIFRLRCGFSSKLRSFVFKISGQFLNLGQTFR